MELFIDSFGVYSTRNTSVSGIYISFFNIRRGVKHIQDNIQTVMLIPANVNLDDAIKPVRDDLITLYKGFKAPAYEDGKIREVEVKGALSIIVADHPQACEISRHLGVPAQMNCRICWTTKEERAKYSDKCFNYRYTRRRVQTDLIVQQMRQQLEIRYTKTKQNKLQHDTGIRCEDCPLRGVEVDPHLQCGPDFDHFFDLGICLRLFNFICHSLTSQEQQQVEVRLKGINMPRGWNNFSINLKSVSKKMKPMSYVRKLCILGIYLFKSLIPEDIEKLMRRMIKLRGMLLLATQTDETIAQVFLFLFMYIFLFIPLESFLHHIFQ